MNIPTCEISLEFAMYFVHVMLSILDKEERIFFNIFRWWRINKHGYLIISIIAHNPLTLRISIIALEFAF